MDSHTLCSQLANYWRSWFGVPTEGATFESYPDSQLWGEPEQPSAPVQVIIPDATQAPQVPVQILQVAWFLSALLNENPEANAGLIREIQRGQVGQLRDLRRDRVAVLILHLWQPCPPSWASWQICYHSNMPPAKRLRNSPMKMMAFKFLTSFKVEQYLAF